MKKILILFLILLVSGCATIKYVEVPIPIEVDLNEEPPTREIAPKKEDSESVAKFLLRRVQYYSDLVKEWESWGIYIYDTLDKPVPESLQSLKNSQENNNEQN